MAAVVGKTAPLEGRTDTPVASPRIDQTPATAEASKARYVWALTRLSIGWVFLWAFLDKTFGLGFATERADAWINGGSPTFGFLTFGTSGPFAESFQGIAGAAWADWLFMVGLLGIGLALMLGVTMRIAAFGGVVLLLLMWLAAPPVNNPFMDDHIIYALVLVGLTLAGAGKTWGLGKAWERIGFVQRSAILK